ncbi:MAG: hypothetical protein HKN23_05840 [Verrucomicrobiales bacterium]|nr:hypothetical protein [Verrucomicrobiales bacterium]
MNLIVSLPDFARNGVMSEHASPNPPKKSNAGKIIGCTCLGLLTVAVLGIGGCFYGIIALLKENQPYKDGVAAVQASAEAKAALGDPIKPGFLPSGNISINGENGEAAMAIPVSGPNGKGTVHVIGKLAAGAWSYETFELEVEGQTDRIPLAAP